jgi:hypothetical protein|tara:strand:+ start:1840 stop:2481 length:642 start_codon:yes stop_codon:yes gene_type:complete
MSDNTVVVHKDAFEVLHDEAARESADYVRQYIKDAVITDVGWWNVAPSKIEVKGLCMEFGVYEGLSLNHLARCRPDITWYGFDSFLGLQEDWKGGTMAKGAFSTAEELPQMEKNVTLIKGWFKDTLPNFLLKYNLPISMMHIDCDTYESTKEVLDIIGKDRLVKGTRILFDEYHSYIGWKEGEFKAWKEFVIKNNIKYKYELFGRRQALVKII